MAGKKKYGGGIPYGNEKHLSSLIFSFGWHLATRL
jgi:hypothetical protein